jgi:hypothetical protein
MVERLHDEGCPICEGNFADDGLSGWQELAACALSCAYAAIEAWRATPANSAMRGIHLRALTGLHNCLAEHAAALDPVRFAILKQDQPGLDDGGEGVDDE